MIKLSNFYIKLTTKKAKKNLPNCFVKVKLEWKDLLNSHICFCFVNYFDKRQPLSAARYLEKISGLSITSTFTRNLVTAMLNYCSVKGKKSSLERESKEIKK